MLRNEYYVIDYVIIDLPVYEEFLVCSDIK